VNQHAKYLGKRSRRSEVIVRAHTQTSRTLDRRFPDNHFPKLY